MKDDTIYIKKVEFIMKNIFYLSLIIFLSGCSQIFPNNFSMFNRDSKIEIESSEKILNQREVTLEPIIIEDNRAIKRLNRPKKRIIVDRNSPKMKELRKIMREFDYLIFSKINMDMLQGEEDMFFGKNIYPLLKDFIKNSKKISTLYPKVNTKYKKLAQSLYKKARVLNYIIKKRKTQYFKLQLNSIIDTCNQCHAIYNR
jgi:hypothetical protein